MILIISDLCTKKNLIRALKILHFRHVLNIDPGSIAGTWRYVKI